MNARGRHGLLLASAALCLWTLWPFLRMLAGVYEHVPDHSHGYFVPLVSGIILYQLWPFRHAVPVQTNAAGLPVFALGLAGMTFGLWYEIALYPAGAGPEVIGAAGLFLTLAGAVLALFGPARLRFFSFPLCFLLLAVPYPDQVSRLITGPMRELVTVLAERSLQLSGYNVFREGNLLHLATVSLGVEDVCSGIRSLWASLAAAFAIAWFTGCRRWKLLPMLLSGILLAILQNGVRIYLSAVLAHRFGEHWAAGWRHETLGIITLTLALFALLGIGLRIGRDELPRRPDDPCGMSESATYLLQHWRMFYALLGGLLLALAGRYLVQRHYDARDHYLGFLEEQRQPLEGFPDRIGPYRCIGRVMPEVIVKQTASLHFTDAFYGTFVGPERTPFEVLVMYWDPLQIRHKRQWVYPHSPDVCFPSAGWKVAQKYPADPVLFDVDREWLLTRLYRKSDARRIIYYWNNKTFAQRHPHRKPSYRDRFAGVFKSWKQPRDFMGVQYSIAIYTHAEAGEEATRAAVRDFASELKPALVPYGPGHFRPEGS